MDPTAHTLEPIWPNSPRRLQQWGRARPVLCVILWGIFWLGVIPGDKALARRSRVEHMTTVEQAPATQVQPGQLLTGQAQTTTNQAPVRHIRPRQVLNAHPLKENIPVTRAGAPTAAPSTRLEPNLMAHSLRAHLIEATGAETHHRQRRTLRMSGGSMAMFALNTLFFLYKEVVSSQDSARCGFTPSCSVFALQAIPRLGFVRGMLLTSDRLQRDNPLSHPHYARDPSTGLAQDPVDNYCHLVRGGCR